jgi:voltage-gated potassium channel Kch
VSGADRTHYGAVLRPHLGAASSRHARARNLWEDYHWYALVLLLVLALALGIDGFRRHFDASGEHRSPTDLLYLTLQLFTLKSGNDATPTPWELDVARFLAPAVALSAALYGLAAVFREQLQLLRTRFWRGHVVVCGLSGKGRLFAESFREQGDRILAIEIDPHAPEVAACKSEGIPVLVGDASDERVLRRARVERARVLVAVCGADATNAQTAAEAGELTAAYGGTRDVLTAFVHVVDPELCDLLGASAVAGEYGTRFRLEFFNVFERGARAWLSEHPPFGDGKDHLVVVGSDEFALVLVAGAARERFSASGVSARRPRITLVAADALAKAELLSLRYPGLAELCELVPHALEVASAGFERGAFADDAGAVYVCLDDESRGLTAALSLAPRLRARRIPVVVRVARTGGLPQLIGEREELRAFSLLERTCRAVLLTGATRNELIARAMHEEYVRKQAEDGETPATNPSMVTWEQLPESLRESNRRQADHIPLKLKAIGCATIPLGDWRASPLELTADEVERLARLEHDRWMAERLLDGWTYAPEPKDLQRRTTPWLIRWEDMPDAQRDYDRNTVRNLPRFLAQAGLQLVRLEQPVSVLSGLDYATLGSHQSVSR